MNRIVCQFCGILIEKREGEFQGFQNVCPGVCPHCLPKLAIELREPVYLFLDALAPPIIVFKEYMKVLAFNIAAQNALSISNSNSIGNPPGVAFGCKYAREAGSCGRTLYCKSCAIRNSVDYTYRSGKTRQGVLAYVNLVETTSHRTVEFVITTRKSGNYILLQVNRIYDFFGYSHKTVTWNKTSPSCRSVQQQS